MWYILILYFAGVFFWNMYIKEYDDDCEIEMIKDVCYPMLGVAVSAILGLIF